MSTDTKNNGKIYTIRWILRALILASGIYQLFFGEAVIGVITLLTSAVIILPGFFTRGFIKRFPIEIEVILFIMVLFQFILGEARDFYTTVPYYDKFVHYMLPMFLGIIGFTLFYTLYATGGLRTTVATMMVIIIFITLGIGALWEIFEYGSDVLIEPRIPNWHHFQGNAQQSALDDTMTDLIIDTLGGIFGALLGLWYMKKALREKNPRANELLGEVSELFIVKPQSKKKKSR